jgi:serine/threonine-protein kinase RsbW
MTMTATSGESTSVSDTVDLRVPADPAYLAVLRTATAGLAARLDLTLDEIEDLRIAVDEACALLLEHTSHLGEELHAAFTIHPQALDVLVKGPARTLPEKNSFAWSVLEALVGQVETGVGDHGSWIRLTHVGAAAGRPGARGPASAPRRGTAAPGAPPGPALPRAR